MIVKGEPVQYKLTEREKLILEGSRLQALLALLKKQVEEER